MPKTLTPNAPVFRVQTTFMTDSRFTYGSHKEAGQLSLECTPFDRTEGWLG